MVKLLFPGKKSRASEEIIADSLEQLKQIIEVQEKAESMEHNLREKIIHFKKILDYIDKTILDMLSWQQKLKLSKYLKEQAYPIVEELQRLAKESQYELHIIGEEKKFVSLLSKDLKYKHWKAVYKEVKKEEVLESIEEHEIRLDIKSLKLLHGYFNKLKQVMARTKVLEEELEKQKFKVEQKTGEELERSFIKIRYYLMDLYDFSKAYEFLFKDLLDKEQILLKNEEAKTIILEQQIKERQHGKTHT